MPRVVACRHIAYERVLEDFLILPFGVLSFDILMSLIGCLLFGLSNEIKVPSSVLL